MRDRIHFSFFTFLIIASIGCNRHDNSSDSGVFRYNESAGISSLDPAFARNLENMWAVNQLFDGLVELDSSLNVQPLIARSWEISEDGLDYIFHLRRNVYFHDHEVFLDSIGRRVTSSDFQYSFSRILDPKVASPGKWVFDAVDVSNGGGFSTPDDSTLIIHLKKPHPPFLGMLTMQYCNVVPREIVEHFNTDFRNNPVGTGPFKFALWIEGIALVYHKNERFWQKDEYGKSLPYLEALKVDFVSDMNSEFMGLLKGDYDFMSGINPAYKDELLNPFGQLNDAFQGEIRFQKTPFIKTDYLGILVDDSLDNALSSPLYTKRVRQALNMAINREQMVRYLRNNAVYPANQGFIPRGLPSFDSEASYGYGYDPSRAQSLLEEAGYTRDNPMPSISLATTADYVDLCEFIQHQWGEIGVETSIDVLPSSTHREYVAKSKLNLFRKSWLADYSDAENFLGLFYSPNFCPGGPNYTHFRNREFDSLFVSSQREIDNGRRYELYRQMDSIVMAESPVIPLFYDQVSHFVRKEVSGLVTNPINMLDLKTVRKGGDQSSGNQ